MTDEIRARLDEWMDPAAPWDEDRSWGEREAMANALRAVFDLCDEYPMGAVTTDQVREAIADKLGATDD